MAMLNVCTLLIEVEGTETPAGVVARVRPRKVQLEEAHRTPPQESEGPETEINNNV